MGWRFCQKLNPPFKNPGSTNDEWNEIKSNAGSVRWLIQYYVATRSSTTLVYTMHYKFDGVSIVIGVSHDLIDNLLVASLTL